MSNHWRATTGAATLALGFFATTAMHDAQAAVMIFGGTLAKSCFLAAKNVADGLFVPPTAIEECTLAIAGEPLQSHDLAGTYTNRGILYLGRAAYADARRDFDMAVKMMPDLAEAYINRGATSVALGEAARERGSNTAAARSFKQAIEDLDRGLAFFPDQPEKAYFNRAIAHEGLHDLKNAFLDYTTASQLKPDWEEPQKQLVRFQVTRPTGNGTVRAIQ